MSQSVIAIQVVHVCYVRVHIHTYIYICMYIYIYIFVYLLTYTYKYICICLCTLYICMYFICVRMFVYPIKPKTMPLEISKPGYDYFGSRLIFATGFSSGSKTRGFWQPPARRLVTALKLSVLKPHRAGLARIHTL